MENCIHPISYRYGSSEIRDVFSKSKWLDYMKKVELELLKALAKNKVVDEDLDWDLIEKAFRDVDINDVMQWEKLTKHETMAVVSALSEKAGEYGKYIHVGATSNDILDTVLALQLKEAHDIIIDKLRILNEFLIEKSFSTRKIPILGRTHGRAAIPTTYGFKFGLFIDELSRLYFELSRSINLVGVGKLGGAVGTQVELFPLGDKVEMSILASLHLKESSYYTQVIPRDRLAIYLLNLITLSSVLDQLANEIRNLQRSEIEEVFEPFSKSQVGSSVMPHKKNPINSEKVCGIAKILRGYAIGILENIVLEHERDLTNSSFERCVIPEIFILLDEQLKTMIHVIKNLEINEDNALKNLRLQEPYIYSDLVLQKAAIKGANRQVAHDHLKKILLSKTRLSKNDFIEKIMNDSYLSKYLTIEDVKDAMDINIYVKAAEKRLLNLLDSLRARGFEFSL